MRHPCLHDAAADGVLTDGFDRGNGHPGDTIEVGDAGSGGLAIDQDGTSTALSDAAAILVPVMPSSSRMTQSSGVSGSAST